MKFEDTKLPDHPATRIAFQKTEFTIGLARMDNPGFEDLGIGPDSQKLLVRAGEILSEAIPAADPELVAGAVLFLSMGFQEPSLIQRAHADDLPRVCEWAQEWRNINTGGIYLGDASLELRQIITAANIAIIEGFKNNISLVDAFGVRQDLSEKDRMAREVGDLQEPALLEKFQQMRREIDWALDPAKAAREEAGESHDTAATRQASLKARAAKFKIQP